MAPTERNYNALNGELHRLLQENQTETERRWVVVRSVAKKLGVADNPEAVSALETLAYLSGFSVDAAVEVVRCFQAGDHEGEERALQRFKESIRI